MQSSPWDDDSDNVEGTNAPSPIALAPAHDQFEQSGPAPSMQDSVVGGNLHTGNVVNNHYHPGQQAGQMQPAQQPMIMGAPSQPYGYGQQPIIIQQAPSSAPKVIGILVIIYASLSILGEAFGTLGPGGNGLTFALAAVNILAYGGMIFGGVQMLQFNRQGVYIVMGAIALVAFSTIASFQIVLDYDEMLENGDISQQEYDVITDEDLGGAVTVIGTISVVICNGICMAIVAIPLMIANNGFQSQKNYGMTP